VADLKTRHYDVEERYMTSPAISFRGTAAIIVFAAIGTFIPAIGSAQALRPGSDADRFEVASIKPGARPRVPVPQVLPGGVLQLNGVTVSDLIRFAYPTANGQVMVDKAPGWVTTERFDVMAKSAGAVPSAAMLRALLAERFKLRTRLEPRQGTVFELTMSRKDGRLGPGLWKSSCGMKSEAPPASPEEGLARTMSPPDPSITSPCQDLRIGAGPSLIGQSVTIADLARTLTYAPMFSLPVIDRTGLTDRYDFRMQYRGDNDPNPDHGPQLPTALQEQLGLKIERTTGTIDVIVIEQVEALEPN
jgi:uncharacterized protein (TIGR03435 family)